MADTQHFCLRWNNYQSSITSAFENLRDDEDFVDVTLACDGRSIKAHRVVLSACSPYFRELLKSTPCKHPVIVLQDISFHDLHALVEFIYHGEVNVHQKSLSSFLKTAEVLRVSGLTQQQAEDSQLAQIQNLANSGARTPINHHPYPEKLHDEPLYPRGGCSPPPSHMHSPHTNSVSVNQMLRRAAAAAALRRDRNNSTHSDELGMKRHRPDNGISSNNNSPDPNNMSPQVTPADFSTIKHNNNNTPPLKEEKRNGPTGNGNGISSNDKDFLTPSPHARSSDDVKSEPMELVCPNNNPVSEEHSNDSTGEHDANRSSSGEGGKGSLSSVNDDEIENSIHSHTHSSFLMSPGESKLFPTPGPFNFPMGPLDSALAGFSSQLQSAAEMAVSPQGPQNAVIPSSTTSTINSTSCSSPTSLKSPGGLLGGSSSNSNCPVNGGGGVGGMKGNNQLSPPSPQHQPPLRMPPPTSGGINEPQECPYCRRTFSCYYSLKRHFQDKHEQSDTLYVCEFCHRRYRTKNSLTTHKSLQHRGSSGMLKRLLKTSAIKNVLGPHHHPMVHHQRSMFDFTSELGQPPPGIQ